MCNLNPTLILFIYIYEMGSTDKNKTPLSIITQVFFFLFSLSFSVTSCYGRSIKTMVQFFAVG